MTTSEAVEANDKEMFFFKIINSIFIGFVYLAES